MAASAESFEWVLTRWTLLMQLGVVVIFALVFAVAAVITARRVILTWAVAWGMDILALVQVYVIAIRYESLSAGEIFALYCGYAMAKLAFSFLIALGFLQYRRVSAAMNRKAVELSGVVAVLLAAVMALALNDPVHVQAMTYLGVSVVLVAAGLTGLGPGNMAGERVAGLVLLLDGLVFAHHAAVMVPTLWGRQPPEYMTRTSAVDGLAELLLALGCALALGVKVLSEVREANLRLEESQRALRALVDTDPLTGLANRRSLRRFVDSTSGSGTLFFFDIDRFKEVNDHWGHDAGDRALVRMAQAMRTVFRTTDGLFRLGGDEFVAVVPGLKEAEARSRVEHLRAILAKTDQSGQAISVSVGTARFGQGIPFEEALAAADAAMYQDKRRRRT